MVRLPGRSVVAAAAVSIVSILIGGPARAQTPANQVEIESTRPGASIMLLGPVGEIPCGERCTLNLFTGKYRVIVTHDGGRQSVQYLFIGAPSRVSVTPENRGLRRAGFVLMGAGVATYAVGGVLAVYWVLREAGCGDGGDGCDNGSRTLAYVGLTGMGVGVALAATGFYLSLVHKNPRVDVAPLGSPPPGRTHLRLQPVAGPRWTGLALSGSF